MPLPTPKDFTLDFYHDLLPFIKSWNGEDHLWMFSKKCALKAVQLRIEEATIAMGHATGINEALALKAKQRVIDLLLFKSEIEKL